MEEMLYVFVFPELTSNQPFMRLRACHTYGNYCQTIKITNEEHLNSIVQAIYSNMSED